jgi:O-antigen/teichoic acid export membrane protein
LVSELIVIIGNSFGRIANPLIAEYWNAEDKNKVKKIYYDAISMQLFLGLFVFIFLNVFANILLGILGKEYIIGAGVLLFITASHLIDLVSGLSGSVINLSKIYRFDFFTRLFQVILVVITNMIFIPWMGLTGAALATCISVFLFNALKAIIVYKFFRMFPFSVDALKVLFSGAIIWGISLFFKKYINNIFILAIFEMVIGIIYFSINFFIFKIDFLKRYIEKRKIFLAGDK